MSDDKMADFDLNNESNMNRPQIQLTTNQSIPDGGIQQAGKDREEIITKENKDNESYNLEDNISASSDEENPAFSFDIHQELAGLQKKESEVNSRLINNVFGDWEKYTKGIGSKLLLKMGYQSGYGLGKELQGIVEPIEINLSEGREEIGAYGPESKTKPMEIDSKNTTNISKDNQVLVSVWSKTLSKPLRRNILKTNKLIRIKDIDMNGAEQRILSGNHTNSLPEQNISINQELSKSDDQNIIIEQTTKKIRENIIEKNYSDRYVFIITSLQDGLKKRMLDSSLAIELLTELKENYSDCWLQYGPFLSLLISQILVAKMLSTWDPLQDPTMPFKELNNWKELLIDPCAVGFKSNYEFRTLIWQEWVPKVQEACRRWKCQEYNSMLKLIEQSVELIPSDIINIVLENMILPQIQSELEQLTDLVPIHLWILPWLPYLGKYFETTIYPKLRQKLSEALNDWHPSNNFAKLVLQPWINIIQKDDEGAFIKENIIPKLQAVLCDFDIHPYNQQLDCWNWVNAWSDILPLSTFVELLDQYFFPKWLLTLETMLTKKEPDYEDMSTWYLRWKGLMPSGIVEHPTIKARFHSASVIMSQPSSSRTTSSIIHSGLAEGVDTTDTSCTASLIPPGFRELVQKCCEDRGILWMPIPGCFRETQQVYKCGANLQAFIGRTGLFVSQDKINFYRVSLQSMLEECE